MEVADAPDSVLEVQKICQQVIDKWEGRHVPFASIERHAFYERSRQAFAIRGDRRATHLRLHHRQEGRGDRLRRSVMAGRPTMADVAFSVLRVSAGTPRRPPRGLDYIDEDHVAMVRRDD
jgi:hypothetical protein